MYRTCCSLAAAFLLAAAAFGQAPATLSGNYKLTLVLQKEQPTYWLVRFDPKGKPQAEVISAADNAPDAKISEVAVKDGVLRLGLQAQGRSFLFLGRLQGENKKVLGSFALTGRGDQSGHVRSPGRLQRRSGLSPPAVSMPLALDAFRANVDAASLHLFALIRRESSVASGWER